MAGPVEAAPAVFVLHNDRPSSLIDGLTSSLNRAARRSASTVPLPDSNPTIGAVSCGSDLFIGNRTKKTIATPPRVPSFSAFPPSTDGQSGAPQARSPEQPPPQHNGSHGTTQGSPPSSVLMTPSFISTRRHSNGGRPRLQSLSQPTASLAYPVDQSVSTIPTTATTHPASKRHSVGGSATLSLLQATSPSSNSSSRTASPPASSPATKSLGRSLTMNSPPRPVMTSTVMPPRNRTQSLLTHTSVHMKRGESASETSTTQYTTLEDAAAEAARRAERSEPSSGIVSARRSSFGGGAQAPLGTLSVVEPSQESQVRERTAPRTSAIRGGLEAKLVILGSQGVGKTSLAYRYTSGQFNPSAVPSTIGAAFLTKKLVVDNVKCRLQLWDTSGQEKWRAIAPMYYRGSHAALLVYDITSRRSFEDLKYWIEELSKNMDDDLVIHVVGSKLDLATSAREVDPIEAKEQILQWLRPDRVAALAASRTQPFPAQPVSGMTASTSRLGSLSSLAFESASRLATAFPSTGRSVGMSLKATGSSNSTGSGGPGSDDAGENVQPVVLPGDDAKIELSEVSSKDDRGIEEVFLSITQKLVQHREEIEQRRLARERQSIFLGAAQDGQDSGNKDDSASKKWTWC